MVYMELDNEKSIGENGLKDVGGTSAEAWYARLGVFFYFFLLLVGFLVLVNLVFLF